MNLFVLLNLSSPNAVMALDLDIAIFGRSPRDSDPISRLVGVIHGQLDTKAGRSL